MFEKLGRASSEELEVWMVTAGIVAFGLGLLIDGQTRSYAPLIVALGTALHLAAFLKIYFHK